jgi:hypothetical protein
MGNRLPGHYSRGGVPLDGRELTDQLPEFLQVTRNRREWIFLCLVFQYDVSTVICLLENTNQSTYVGGHLLAGLVP